MVLRWQTRGQGLAGLLARKANQTSDKCQDLPSLLNTKRKVSLVGADRSAYSHYDLLLRLRRERSSRRGAELASRELDRPLEERFERHFGQRVGSCKKPLSA